MSKAILTKAELERLNLPKDCTILNVKINSLSKFLEVIYPAISETDGFWFRGQKDSSWTLTPSAFVGRVQTLPIGGHRTRQIFVIFESVNINRLLGSITTFRWLREPDLRKLLTYRWRDHGDPALLI